MENVLPLPIAAKPSSPARWGGRVLSGIPALFLAVDAFFKIVLHPEVAKASATLGIPLEVTRLLGLILMACTILYVIPRLAPLGAALLTGYLGGAVFVHVRVGDPLFSHILFSVYVGVMLWGGLFLRDSRVRNLLSNPKEIAS
jgi:hypothetical protein